MIYLICSTIRPQKFVNTHEEWAFNASNNDNFTTKVVVDTEKDQRFLENLGYDVIRYTGGTRGITKPLTMLTQSMIYVKDNDIIVVMSDDYYPPKDWDKFLIDTYKEYTGGINVYEGRPEKIQNEIVPLPIVDGATLKKLNYIIYHPAYTHMYSDNELRDNLAEMGLIKNFGITCPYKFEHRHWVFGKRTQDDHDKTLGKLAILDKQIYAKRKELTLEQRLEVVSKEIKLSILICSLNKRAKSLERLLGILDKQKTSQVEILIKTDDGEMNIGEKRNKLIDLAKGEYICFIDDDDIVSENYIPKIIEACKLGPDVVGIVGEITTDGRNPFKFISSTQYKHWSTNHTDRIYYRNPNHLNPTKSSIVKKVRFDDSMNGGEDKEYSDRLYDQLGSEVRISQPIYKYLFSTKDKSY